MKTIIINSQKYGQHIVFYDALDYDTITKYNWHIIKSFNTYYAQTNYYPDGKERTKANRRSIKMHQILLNENSNNMVIDHKDGNGLNNQRSNIRLCTNLDNSRNRMPYGKVPYKGVFITKGKYRAVIHVNKKRTHLGYFANPIEAAKAYNIKAVELFGEFAYLNSI